jgi:hypothetical protein
MPQRASVFCNFYIRVDREALVSERALDVGSVAFKAMSTKNFLGDRTNYKAKDIMGKITNLFCIHLFQIDVYLPINTY